MWSNQYRKKKPKKPKTYFFFFDEILQTAISREFIDVDIPSISPPAGRMAWYCKTAHLTLKKNFEDRQVGFVGSSDHHIQADFWLLLEKDFYKWISNDKIPSTSQRDRVSWFLRRQIWEYMCRGKWGGGKQNTVAPVWSESGWKRKRVRVERCCESAHGGKRSRRRSEIAGRNRKKEWNK